MQQRALLDVEHTHETIEAATRKDRLARMHVHAAYRAGDLALVGTHALSLAQIEQAHDAGARRRDDGRVVHRRHAREGIGAELDVEDWPPLRLGVVHAHLMVARSGDDLRRILAQKVHVTHPYRLP